MIQHWIYCDKNGKARPFYNHNCGNTIGNVWVLSSLDDGTLNRLCYIHLGHFNNAQNGDWSDQHTEFQSPLEMCEVRCYFNDNKTTPLPYSVARDACKVFFDKKQSPLMKLGAYVALMDNLAFFEWYADRAEKDFRRNGGFGMTRYEEICKKAGGFAWVRELAKRDANLIDEQFNLCNAVNECGLVPNFQKNVQFNPFDCKLTAARGRFFCDGESTDKFLQGVVKPTAALA